MTTTLIQLFGRLCGRDTRQLPQRQPAIEPLEGRLLMSGDSLMGPGSGPHTAMLVPAIQAAREAARTQIVDGTSNTVMFADCHS
jgi:hypothetical protein